MSDPKLFENQDFLAIDEDGNFGRGKTLAEAAEDYKDSHDNYPVEDLEYMLAVPLQVKHEIVPVSVPVFMDSDPASRSALGQSNSLLEP